MTVYKMLRNNLFLFASLLIIWSCGSSKKIPQVPARSVQIDGAFADWAQGKALNDVNATIHVKMQHDEKNVYVYLRFNDRRYFNRAVELGLDIYFDGERGVKRSFGLTYPVGLQNELLDRGLWTRYQENPGFFTAGEGRDLISSIDDEMWERALIMNRFSKNASKIRLPQPLPQLAAQGIAFAVDRSGQTMSIEFAVPIYLTRTTQFAIEPTKKGEFNLGIEIASLEINESVGNAKMLNPAAKGADRVGRQETGVTQRGMIRSMDEEIVDEHLAKIFNQEYSKWFTLKLSGN